MATTQRSLEFDRVRAEKRRGLGIARAKKAHSDVLLEARRLARQEALRRATREVTIDSVMYLLIQRGYESEDLGNAAGSVFKTSEWEFTGRWVKSTRTSNHSRSIRVWRYLG